MKQENPILVIAGTGKTGRRIVRDLQDMNIPVRVGSRQATVPFEWEKPQTWPGALEGIKTAFVTYVPDLACKGAHERMQAFSIQMKASGVERVVLLSGRGEPLTLPSENTIKDDFDWTVLRCSWFNQNFDEGFFAEPLAAGFLALPVKDIPEPFIDVNDIAACAIKLLTEPGHKGKTYEITGPRALTFAEAVAEMAAAAKCSMHFHRIPMGTFIDEAKQKMPPEVVELMAYLFVEVLDGRNSQTTDDLEKLLGRPAKDFKAYAEEAAATGVWQAREEVHA